MASDKTDPRGDLAVELRNGRGLAIGILRNGAIHAIRHGPILINQVIASPVGGGIGNLYLRSHRGGRTASAPLIGPSGGALAVAGEAAAWSGTHEGLEYRCTLQLAPIGDGWFWTIHIANASGASRVVDAVYAQDIGIADEAAVRTNELYTSQYIDHTILRDADFGYVLCARQNLTQGGAHPWLMLGCLGRALGYLTDGFQFYGAEYRATNAPLALERRRLPNRRYQYEFALPTVASRALRLRPGEAGDVTFFASYLEDHAEASGPDDLAVARAAASALGQLSPSVAATEDGAVPIARSPTLFDNPTLFRSRDLPDDELERWFGGAWRHVERRDGRLLSFFHGHSAHVVLREKELAVERPTGHILRSGRDLLPADDMLSSTAWMSGVFASQLTMGNTSLHKVLSVSRNPLNVLKSSGQRIFVITADGPRLLAVPSAFEMDANSARWLYDDGERAISIRAWTSLDDPAWFLDVSVERGDAVELLITNDVIVGSDEDDAPGAIGIDAAAGRVELVPAAGSAMQQQYPESTFWIVSPDRDAIAAIGHDELLHEDGARRGHRFLVVRTRPVRSFRLAVTGSILDAQRARELADRYGAGWPRFEDASHDVVGFWTDVRRGATLRATGPREADVARLDDVLPWYVQNAMIHYLAPHGLEQYSGAAWGLRDVCQGPIELLLATRHHAEMREVLKVVYAHQFRGSGDWPQWFMYDRHRAVQASESHGDIVHWPLKAVCDYVEATGDTAILREQIPYTDEGTMAVTESREALLSHIERQLARIEAGCIPGTALLAYGHGDWEDTLQPADPAMAERLVSSWTVELAYQTLGRFAAVCERAGEDALAHRLREWCERIRADFNRYLMPDGIVAGLAHFDGGRIEYFLHPADRRTGVSYRLLPMTRGMLSGLFTPDQVARHLSVIDRHLSFPDGVRLMNRPMEYRGGVERHFRRAETAANFGREIGLQYVHAHIRYVEAMAMVGRPEAAFEAMLAICPIGLERTVPTALPRQANAYFSSSDAAFADRYEASRHFGRLRRGTVGVKGGWRVYSSGPGMYVNQLISSLLGLRELYDDVLLDPVLPRALDGLTFDFEYDGRRVRYRYRVSGDGVAPDEIVINGRPMSTDRRATNPYRRGGVLLPKDRFLAALNRDDNLVEIRL